MKKKRTTKNKNSTNKILKNFIWVLVAVLLSIVSIGIGYYFGYEDGSRYSDISSAKQKEKTLKALKKLEKATASSQEEDIKDRLKTVLKEEQNRYAQEGASHEYEESPEQLEHPPIVKAVAKEGVKSRPKLAIIIDDVSFARDVREIKKLNLNVTMSFLPPNAIHPNSAILASKEPFYMVHLPMEAMNFHASEPITLKVRDSQQVIMKRIDQIVKLFPRVKYINNHTGSKFTSNEVAMNRLIFALNKYHINFVDSRTIAETKVPKVMKAYGKRYIARDVFLDHKMEVDYVKGQIREAVKVAKLKGYAIAIGHPHENTLEALRESKDILSQVDLVQINKI
ncbi:divergent polysaccharide deacetylase family protein [Sulfurimonas sp. HSL-1716]|uniref:divergent polysaccharide deacetylase family protein n=1 Tax=Hydrocurvibacter sulfurireducens TaxID=3131937 RepID=UPI0031F98A0C